MVLTMHTPPPWQTVGYLDEGGGDSQLLVQSWDCSSENQSQVQGVFAKSLNNRGGDKQRWILCNLNLSYPEKGAIVFL